MSNGSADHTIESVKADISEKFSAAVRKTDVVQPDILLIGDDTDIRPSPVRCGSVQAIRRRTTA